MRKQFKQLGQGMTEYIIIIALIAIAGIGAFTYFGEGLKKTVGDVTTELTGGDVTARTQATEGDTLKARGMKDFSTTFGSIYRLQAVVVLALGNPAYPFFPRKPGTTADHFKLFSNDEG